MIKAIERIMTPPGIRGLSKGEIDSIKKKREIAEFVLAGNSCVATGRKFGVSNATAHKYTEKYCAGDYQISAAKVM